MARVARRFRLTDEQANEMEQLAIANSISFEEAAKRVRSIPQCRRHRPHLHRITACQDHSLFSRGHSPQKDCCQTRKASASPVCLRMLLDARVLEQARMRPGRGHRERIDPVAIIVLLW